MPSQNKVWFPAKTHGYGWGPPTCWQGWVFMGVYFTLFGIGAVTLIESHGAGLFVGYVLALTTILLLVCWWKGEPLRWRSGKE